MDEPHFNTLRELAKDGSLSQRELSRRMGLSLGRVNYIVNSLLRKGYIKARRFKNSKNKIAYMYILTPKGISTRLTQTYDFLQRKLDEYDRLRQEIEMLKRETTMSHEVFKGGGPGNETFSADTPIKEDR